MNAAKARTLRGREITTEAGRVTREAGSTDPGTQVMFTWSEDEKRAAAEATAL